VLEYTFFLLLASWREGNMSENIGHIDTATCDLTSESELLRRGLHHRESLLIIDPATTYEDLEIEITEGLCTFCEGVDNPSKGLINMSKIRNGSSDDEILPILSILDEAIEKCECICLGIFTIRIPATFTIIRDHISIAHICESISKDH